ncbi:MAG: hypothetical protein WB765_17625 [Acidimicrobiales bacterium]
MAQQPVFQLRIRLEDIEPPVWRRVLVPGGAKLSRLHDIFQAKLYGSQFDDYPED